MGSLVMECHSTKRKRGWRGHHAYQFPGGRGSLAEVGCRSRCQGQCPTTAAEHARANNFTIEKLEKREKSLKSRLKNPFS
jgi:hypothetical protein